jgi:hypothetical protein
MVASIVGLRAEAERSSVRLVQSGISTSFQKRCNSPMLTSWSSLTETPSNEQNRRACDPSLSTDGDTGHVDECFNR